MNTLLREEASLLDQHLCTTLNLLGSGSSGNCAILRHQHTTLLIDAGVGIRALRAALKAQSLHVGDLDGILITHAHTDHTKCLSYILAEHPEVPIYTSAGTQRQARGVEHAQFKTIERGKAFEVGSVECVPYMVHHDAQEPLGFRLHLPQGPTIGWATDLGYWDDETVEHLTDCDMMLVEANYDEDMLARSRYPIYTKRRISGRNGHLSNTQARELIEATISSRVQHITLVHLSQNNNSTDLALVAVAPAVTDEQTVVVAANRRQPTLVWQSEAAQRPINLVPAG